MISIWIQSKTAIVAQKELCLYETKDGKRPFDEWLSDFYAVATRAHSPETFARQRVILKITRGDFVAKGTSSYRKSLVARLKADPDFQIEYIKASIEENSDMPEAILLALRDIAEARGFEKLADAADLSRKSLYKILSQSKDSKPRFETIIKLLGAVGLRLTVQEKSNAS